jgi:hypothetical protein
LGLDLDRGAAEADDQILSDEPSQRGGQVEHGLAAEHGGGRSAPDPVRSRLTTRSGRPLSAALPYADTIVS